MPDGCCESKVQAKSRFTDRRARRNNYHLSAVQPLSELIKFIETRGHTRHTVNGCGRDFDFVDGLWQYVTQGVIIFPGSVLADLIDLSLGLVEEVYNLAIGAMPQLGNFGANIDEEAH